MRIAVFSHSAGLGGAERSMLELVAALTGRGHDVVVYLPSDGPLAELAAAADSPPSVRYCASHRWLSPRGRGPAGVIRLIQCLLDLPRTLWALHRCSPDVVVSNTSVTPTPLLAATVLGLPRVVVVREAIATNPVMASALPVTLVVRALHAWSDVVVAVSQFVAEQVRADHVVLEDVRPLAPRTRVRGNGRLRTAVLGAVTRDKGQLDAVRAVAHAVSQGTDVELALYGAGAGRDVSAVLGEVAANGLVDRVVHHGETDDVASVLARTDLLLVPSLNEGFGRVTVEALHAGVPVLGYRSGGTVEAMALGGGLLVEPHATALGEAMTELARDAEVLADLGARAAAAGAEWARVRSTDHLADLVLATGRGPRRPAPVLTGERDE
ncbi:glycosyltransferase family 4 protein [Actinotalea ferrariae]|uniref:glycosyltransferase family 4 protein n=1 Tax=Actinotalea ferrariae TaxID=1386098 RepID=UPI001C8B0C54|nr:glycosyltransferase family 4 protein [Actinotalea ferrariae]MBX9244240.1 glycosyltransferase family 4 protein [Actinotalea ferrariae]